MTIHGLVLLEFSDGSLNVVFGFGVRGKQRIYTNCVYWEEL